MLKHFFILIIICFYLKLNAQNPIMINNYEEGKCYSVCLKDKNAFFAAGTFLKIADFSDTSDIKITGELKLNDEVKDIIVKNDYAFIANNADGIIVLNIFDKTNPSELYRIDSLNNIINIFEKDNYLFAIENDKAVHIFEINNSSNLNYINKIDIAGIDIEKRNDYLYIVDTTYALHIFDISDISSPVDEISYSFNVIDVEIKDEYLFMATNDDSILIYDINLPTEPKRVNEISIGLDVLKLKISGSKMFVGVTDHYWDAGVRVYDIKNKNNIEYIQWLYIYIDYGDLNNCVISIEDEYVGFVSQYWGLYLYKLNNEEYKAEDYCYSLPFSARESILSNNDLFVADKWHGMRILDISDTSNIKQRAFLSIPLESRLSSDKIEKIVLYQNLAYVLSYSQGIKIIDVTDTSKPIIVGEYSNEGLHSYSDFYIKDNFGYLMTRSEISWSKLVLQVLDLSDPINLVERGNLALERKIEDVRTGYFMDHVYILSHEDTLKIVNVSDPDSIIEIKTINTPSKSYYICVNEGYLYLSVISHSSSRGLHIYDVTTPENPTKIAFYYTEKCIDYIDARDSYIYIAMDQEFFILDISDFSDIHKVGEYNYFDKYIVSINSSSNKIFISTKNNGIYLFENSLISNIDEKIKIIPNTSKLKQNYPNPFNPITNIEFMIPKSERVIINIYNNLGQKIKKLIDDEFVSGKHKIVFDGSNLSSGIYYYQIVTKSLKHTRKMLLLK